MPKTRFLHRYKQSSGPALYIMRTEGRNLYVRRNAGQSVLVCSRRNCDIVSIQREVRAPLQAAATTSLHKSRYL